MFNRFDPGPRAAGKGERALLRRAVT